MSIRSLISGYFGRAWFRRVISDPIPKHISDVVGIEFPVPLFRRREPPLVSFSYAHPFERDIQLYGWEDFTEQRAALVVGLYAQRAGIAPGRVYTRGLSVDGLRVWLILDAAGSRACFYVT
jgi:hypothetical protein